MPKTVKGQVKPNGEHQEQKTSSSDVFRDMRVLIRPRTCGPRIMTAQ